MKPEKAFGHVLQAARAAQGFSQEQLAFRSNLDRTFISMLERGLRQPSLTSILCISASLGVPADELVRKTVEVMNENHPAGSID